MFKKLFNLWMKFAVIFGNVMTAIIMTVFYFTVFALFAIPYRAFGKPFKVKMPNSNWLEKEKNLETIDDFKGE